MMCIVEEGIVDVIMWKIIKNNKTEKIMKTGKNGCFT